MDRFVIDFRQLGEDSAESIVAFDAQFRYVYINPQAERLIGTPRDQLLGQVLEPPAELERAMRERAVVEFEADCFNPDRWFHFRCVPESGGGLIVFARETTAVRDAGRARDSAESILSAVVESTSDMVAAIDRERRFLFANAAVARFMGFASPDELIGRSDVELLTGDEDQAMLRRLIPIDESVMETGEPLATEFVTETTPTKDGPRTFLTNKAPLRDPRTGRIVGLVNIIHDITDRETALRRLRRLFDSRVVGIIFWNLDTGRITDANDTFLALVGYSREDLEAGRMDFRAMTPPEWAERNEQGIEAIRRDGAATAYEKEYFRKDGSRVPVLIGGTRFEDSGTDGFSFVIDITERKALEQERERLLAHERARAEREALLNQIGNGIRQALPPDQIEALAVRALGTALGAERCFLMAVDLSQDTAQIVRDWTAPGVRSVRGRYRASAFGLDLSTAFASGRTLAVADQNPPSQPLGNSAFIKVPFYDGDRVVGALGVAMARGARTWTEEEIGLTETVAAQLRSLLEASRLQMRDRNIAHQLQEALQPPLPSDRAGGLALASFYRPALSEAEVGGDFFDVFHLFPGVTALVVADLSGKGLAAAQQVATVRNMLRYALYTGDGLADSVARLHRTLVERDLLSGFATLFVGAYDARKQSLTYVNAGQEPGLIWRKAGGVVEALPRTGPILGGFATEEGFRQETIPLHPGDVLALFTDGMTEVGPSRRQMLGIDGVRDLLGDACRDPIRSAEPDAVVRHLIAGVDRFAAGVAGDDIALLIGCVRADR